MTIKQIASVIALATTVTITSCESSKARYLDLQTGKEVKLEKDESSGLMVDAVTKKPVYIYVDTEKKDTIYGSTGKVINGEVVKGTDGMYEFKGAYDYKSADGDLKVEVEKDGDIKIKDGDNKLKIDGETGEKKVKKD